jgi:uncharacterized membrane protein
MTFAVKTTASGLIALLIAFTFNLDHPQWALLTVFIVSQAGQSGPVLAKSFHRVVGTLIGAAVALLLVAFFAQERVLFLGALAVWIGFCTLGSQYARNFAAYAFVLSGYTAAIVGVPGALDANAVGIAPEIFQHLFRAGMRKRRSVRRSRSGCREAKNSNLLPSKTVLRYWRTRRRNSRASTPTGRKKPGRRHEIQRLPSEEIPPPGTTQCK